jgi:hypothetical protein
MKVVKVAQIYKDMSDDQLKGYIRQKLGMDPAWARRALLALYDEQSPEEQADPVNVHESNGRGFSPADQEFLSSLAVQSQTGSLSQKQLGWLYNLLPKYAGQMVKLVREMERMESNFVLTLYFAQVLISNTRREMTALTGELGLDARSMPEHITVRNPSGDIHNNFKLHDVNVGPQGPQIFIYRGKIDNEEWELIISVGEPDPLPEWVDEMERFMKGPKKEGS